MKPQDVHSSISKVLGAKLEPLITAGKELNLVTCVEIYTTIFDTLVEVVSASELAVSNEGMNYLAQQYYDGVLINGTQELDPEIFTQRAKLEDIDTKELALLAVIFNGTDFGVPIIHEIRKRQ